MKWPEIANRRVRAFTCAGGAGETEHVGRAVGYTEKPTVIIQTAKREVHWIADQVEYLPEEDDVVTLTEGIERYKVLSTFWDEGEPYVILKPLQQSPATPFAVPRRKVDPVGEG